MDLRDVGRMAIGTDEGQEFARQHGLEFFQTSALESKGVDAPFKHIALTGVPKVQGKSGPRAENALIVEMEFYDEAPDRFYDDRKA